MSDEVEVLVMTEPITVTVAQQQVDVVSVENSSLVVVENPSIQVVVIDLTG